MLSLPSMNSKVEFIDRLSELPDPILVHILSFLPICDAVRTMLLKRFGTLWTLLPNLDINDLDFDIWYNTCTNDTENDDDDDSTLNYAFFNFVRNMLVRHRNPKIARFRILINETFYSDIDERNLTHELDSWIDFALKKNVELLEFFVGMVEPGELLYKLPYIELVSDSITEMKLEFLEMKIQNRVQLGLLRVLRLIRVEISDTVFQEIIHGCPLLNELEIYNCGSLNEVKFDAPNVEKLILDTSEHYNFGPTVNCPNLRSFQFTGFVNCMEVKDLSSVVDVTFNLRSQNLEFNEFEQFMSALKPVLSARVVSFSSEFVTVFFYCMVKYLPKLSMNWKRVELSMWLTEKHIPGLCRLIRCSPYLEELVIDVTSWKRDFLQPIESVLDNNSIDDKECCSSSLKRVVLYNISMCLYPTLVQLVSSLLRNAHVLTEFVIYYKVDNKTLYESVLLSEQWAEFSDKLPTFPKASQHARVSLL